MIDKEFCMSSYLVFRYVIDDKKNFYEGMKHRVFKMLPESKQITVFDEYDIDDQIRKQFCTIKEKKIGILLSGGMDSACLASYMEGCDAYTFRFAEGFQDDELKRAEAYSKKWKLNLHYVDIDWGNVEKNVDILMRHKGAPIHSIEPQIYQAARQAKSDGIELMIIGDAADYIFGGMDKLYAKDWEYNEFKKRYTYLEPQEILVNPVDMEFAFEKYRNKGNIDFVSFLHEYADIESYASYESALSAAEMNYLDPYEVLKLGIDLDLQRIRSGESKYLIRHLFKMKYPELEIPEKLPMPRPVDKYFENWRGPRRPEFRKDINIQNYSGNQKWQMWCLDRFLINNEGDVNKSV